MSDSWLLHCLGLFYDLSDNHDVEVDHKHEAPDIGINWKVKGHTTWEFLQLKTTISLYRFCRAEILTSRIGQMPCLTLLPLNFNKIDHNYFPIQRELRGPVKTK